MKKFNPTILISLLTGISRLQRLLALMILGLLLVMSQSLQIGFEIPWLSNCKDWTSFSLGLLMLLLFLLVWSFTEESWILWLGNFLAPGTLFKFPTFLSWYGLDTTTHDRKR